ncbi:dihydrofolate reductase family protein [Nocardiopsis quinghaiensis]|uniref:dihydrofolate reductase family protein n=1 Tax=Nocardiopsis quinghaiensis TaxID=464995 RepID=UPI00123BD45B|nr:dihydrofolate reductase family protein [Nocardiopsis quinghaiensis]
MGKIIVSPWVTVDGVIESPHEWQLPFWSEDMRKFSNEQLFSVSALLLGRVTYEGFAGAWPSRGDEDEFSATMNKLPKYVVSTTLENPEWNNSAVIGGDAVSGIAELKEKVDGDILVYGSGTLANTLLSHGLGDEYRVWVHPTVVGKGKRLFEGEVSQSVLSLTGTTTFESGVTVLTYVPAAPTE